MKRAFLFSFHTEPAQAIYLGRKRVEFRRGHVNIAPGDRVLIYETKPVGLVTEQFDVAQVLYASPAAVLDNARDRTEPETIEQARPYLEGARMATAVYIEEGSVVLYPRSKRLRHLGLDRAPQSYRRMPGTPPIRTTVRIA
jgi:predicted transcriptional regulator